MQKKKPAPPKCIAVIPSIDGLYLLRRLLPSIDLPKENIIVVDQGSLDGTEDYCKSNGYRVVQLKNKSSFTFAVNRGIEKSLSLDADYVLVINNDTEFKTNIATQLVSRMSQEEKLGILAPRQIIVENDKEALGITRVHWDLSSIMFEHDIGAPSMFPELLDSDFCEFTCVLLSSNLIREIGLLDERYEFYHEDADFAFRAQLAGYRCAYDQTSIIKHFHSSTVKKQKSFNKEGIILRNKNYFLRDYIGPQIQLNNLSSGEISSWSVTNQKLYQYLNKYGLVSQNENDQSLSTLAHPDMVSTDYLLTVWETTKLPKKWIKNLYKFKHIFVPSEWNAEVFKSEGFSNVTVVPFGVDTDTFNPWGNKIEFPWKKSVLTICRGQHRKALDITEKVWLSIKQNVSDTYLILYGKDTGFLCLEDESYESRIFGPFVANIYHNLQIVHLIPSVGEYVSDGDVATLYRSVDLYLLNSRSEGFGYPVIEAMACGTLCLIPNYGSVKEFIFQDNCFSFGGTPSKADYRDKGFSENVGYWWEPDVDDLSAKILAALSEPLHRIKKIKDKARGFVVSNYTWRHTALKFRESLINIEDEKNAFLRSKIPAQQHESDLNTPENLLLLENKLLEYLARQSQQFATYAHQISSMISQSNIDSKNRDLADYLIKNNLNFNFNAISTPSNTIDKILSLEGKDFIDAAYLALLGRESDQEGAKHYLSKLTSEKLTKIDILRDIRKSPESMQKSIPNPALDVILNSQNKKNLRSFSATIAQRVKHLTRILNRH